MPWYALHVHSNHEQTVIDKLGGVGIEAFYPHVVVKRKDKRDRTTKFMPGYVFGSFRLDQKTPVVAIPQVVGILGAGRHALAIPDEEIAAVKLIVAYPAAAAQACAYVSAGDRVRVCGGPLAGLEGYVAFMKSRARVIVSVAMLARSISAEVDADSLELIECAAPPVAA